MVNLQFGDIELILFLLGVITIAILLGNLFSKLVYPRLNQYAARHEMHQSRILLKTIRGEVYLWLTLGVVYTFFTIDPIGGQEIGYFVIKQIAIISIAWFLGRILLNFIEFYTRRGFIPRTSIFPNLTKVSILSITLLILLNEFGISITPILAAFGVGGIAVALALQDTITNMFSGLSILTTRDINPGDYIELETKQEGYVVDVNWRNTTIRSLENTIVIIPNKQLGNMTVTNYHLPKSEINIFVPIGVSYDSKLRKVKEVTIAVAKEVMVSEEGGVDTAEPMVFFQEFGDFSINFYVVLRAKNFQYKRDLTDEFIIRLHERFNKEGIEIPFPIQTLQFKNRELNNQV